MSGWLAVLSVCRLAMKQRESERPGRASITICELRHALRRPKARYSVKVMLYQALGSLEKTNSAGFTQLNIILVRGLNESEITFSCRNTGGRFRGEVKTKCTVQIDGFARRRALAGRF